MQAKAPPNQAGAEAAAPGPPEASCGPSIRAAGGLPPSSFGFSPGKKLGPVPVTLVPTTCTPPIKWPSTEDYFTSLSYTSVMDGYPSSLGRYWSYTNAMYGYPSSLRRYWMMEEEDDDTYFLLDDDEAEVATYIHLVEAERSRKRRRSDAPPKVIRPRDLPSDHKRISDSDGEVDGPHANDLDFDFDM